MNCEACGGKGWKVFNTGNKSDVKLAIQRCDLCEQYDSDNEAIMAVALAADISTNVENEIPEGYFTRVYNDVDCSMDTLYPDVDTEGEWTMESDLIDQ